KGRDLNENPQAALVFHWAQEPRRQVLVTGRVERLPGPESDEYYRSRPVGSRLAAWASHQSRPLVGREELEQAFIEDEASHGADGRVGRIADFRNAGDRGHERAAVEAV